MACVVIDPGLSTTVQDAGRPGFRQWGVPIGARSTVDPQSLQTRWWAIPALPPYSS